MSGSANAEVTLVRLQTDDGNVYRGELIRQTAEVVVLNVEGIDASFDQEDIAVFEILESPEQLYQRRRAELAKDDLAGRLALAREMRDLDALRWAKLELMSLDRDFPEHPVVRDELAIVEAHQRLAQTRADDADNPRRDLPRRPERRGEVEGDEFLSSRQINLIKVYEVDLSTEPRIVISDETLDSFFQKYSDNRLVPTGRRDRGAFKRLDGHEQLDLMFRVQARDLYDQVDVRQEPTPLARFRRTVNPQYVARYFAPTFGHGEIPGLSLFNKRPEDEAEAYTNFYRLTQFRYEGTPMIDRANPKLSLMLQWGLARESARFPAPDIPGWKPAFSSTDDTEYQRYVDWIDSLFKEDLDYGITPALSDELE
ncbi:hypothetical protein [Algisphaera agarilytica]|uniref:hypothetical protein n=1 Tax=Algisphaera agarilytica TaxID=1385975 RepID=UPI001C88380D|nr:hypothetical protein [Algisphaera agarilytica]